MQALIDRSPDDSTYVETMAIFLRSSLASIGLGITIAALSALTFKHLWFLKHQSKLSILLFYSFGYMSFLGTHELRC